MTGRKMYLKVVVEVIAVPGSRRHQSEPGPRVAKLLKGDTSLSYNSPKHDLARRSFKADKAGVNHEKQEAFLIKVVMVISIGGHYSYASKKETSDILETP